MQAGLHRDPLSLHEITQQNSQQSNGNHKHQRETTIAILLADLPSHKVLSKFNARCLATTILGFKSTAEIKIPLSVPNYQYSNHEGQSNKFGAPIMEYSGLWMLQLVIDAIIGRGPKICPG